MVNIDPKLERASANEESLYVDSYNEITADWSYYGSDPYLDAQDEPTSVGNVSAKTKVWSEFTYSNLSVSPSSIINVTVWLYVDCGSEKIRVYIWDDGATSWVNTGDLSGSGWGWKSINITDTLTTEAEINNAKLYLESRAVGGWSGTVQADASYLEVHFNVAGNSYEQVINENVTILDQYNDYGFFLQVMNEDITILDQFNDYGFFLAVLNENITVLDQFNDYGFFLAVFTENILVNDDYRDIIPYFLVVTELINILDYYNETLISDSEPPQYSALSVSPTLAGNSSIFSVRWTDDQSLSGYIFSINNTGSWVNDTFIQITPETDDATVQIAKILNNTVSITISYRWYCNDTANNFNNTGIQSFATTWERDFTDIYVLTAINIFTICLCLVGYFSKTALLSFIGFCISLAVLVPMPITSPAYALAFNAVTIFMNIAILILAVSKNFKESDPRRRRR